MPLNTFCFRVLNWSSFNMPCKYKALGRIAKKYSSKLTAQQSKVIQKIIDRHDRDCTGCHISDIHANILIKAVPEYKEYKSLLQYGRQNTKDEDLPQPDSTTNGSGAICVAIKEESMSGDDDSSNQGEGPSVQQDNQDSSNSKS